MSRRGAAGSYVVAIETAAATLHARDLEGVAGAWVIADEELVRFVARVWGRDLDEVAFEVKEALELLERGARP